MKTLNEILEELKFVAEHYPEMGECPVYVIADHGQMYIQARNVTIAYVFDYQYSMEDILELEELEHTELSKVLPIITIED